MIISFFFLSPVQLLACHAPLTRTSTQAQVSAVHSVHIISAPANEDKMHARRLSHIHPPNSLNPPLWRLSSEKIVTNVQKNRKFKEFYEADDDNESHLAASDQSKKFPLC